VFNETTYSTMAIVCKTYSKVFKFKSGLTRHNGIHKAIRVFCDCGLSFSRKDNIKVHQLTSATCRALEHTCIDDSCDDDDSCDADDDDDSNQDSNEECDDEMTNNLSSNRKNQSLDDKYEIPLHKIKIITKHSKSKRRKMLKVKRQHVNKRPYKPWNTISLKSHAGTVPYAYRFSQATPFSQTSKIFNQYKNWRTIRNNV
jgi:hypothetical protein